MATGSQTLGRPAAVAFRRLDDDENARAVDRIEQAERETPFCLCGESMTVAPHGAELWLECQTHDEARAGVTGVIARLANGVGHTRRMLMELPTLD